MGSPQYSKQLGRIGQKKVRDILLEHAPQLGERDITSRPMGSPGADLILSEAAYKVYPFDIEIKYAKKVNLIRACQQAEEEARGDGTPLSIGCYRLDKPTQWYACLKLEDLLELMK